MLYCDYIKSDSRGNFLKFFVDEIILTKKSAMNSPILVAAGNISENIFVHRRCSSGYCEKYIVQNT